MNSEGSITHWIAELELGPSEPAQEELWNRYFSRLVALARLKLGETPRRVADEEDVAAAALASFFKSMERRKFPQLHDRDDLWPLLAKITARKALDQQRHLFALKRGGVRAHSDPGLAPSTSSAIDALASLVDEQLQPDFLVSMNEQCDRLLELLGDEELRVIARRRLDGFTNAEIAMELGVIDRTIERRLALIRAIWTQDINKLED